MSYIDLPPRSDAIEPKKSITRLIYFGYALGSSWLLLWDFEALCNKWISFLEASVLLDRFMKLSIALARALLLAGAGRFLLLMQPYLPSFLSRKLHPLIFL